VKPSVLLVLGTFPWLTACAYARVSVGLGAGAIGPPPSSSPSVGCNNSAPDIDGNYDTPDVCGGEIRIPRPSNAPRFAFPTGGIGATLGAGFRIAPNLYLEPDFAMSAYVSFAGAASTFRESSSPGTTYQANRPSTAVLLGLPLRLEWRPVSRWSFAASAGPALGLLSQDFSATTSSGSVDHASWSWTSLDVLARASVQYDLWRTPMAAGRFDFRGALGVTAEMDSAWLARGLLLDVSLYLERTPIHGR
jgi:hypothetical protein